MATASNGRDRSIRKDLRGNQLISERFSTQVKRRRKFRQLDKSGHRTERTLRETSIFRNRLITKLLIDI